VALDLIMEGDEAKRVMRGLEVSRMAPRNRADEEEDDDGEEGGSSALRFLEVEVADVEGPLPSVRCCSCCWAEYLSLSFFMRISLAGRLRDNRRLIGGVAFSFFSFVNVVVVVEAGALLDDDVTLRRVWDGFRGGVSNRSISSFSSWLSSRLSSKKMFVEDREGKRCIGVNR